MPRKPAALAISLSVLALAAIAWSHLLFNNTANANQTGATATSPTQPHTQSHSQQHTNNPSLVGREVTVHFSTDTISRHHMTGSFSVNGQALTLTGTFIAVNDDWVRIRREYKVGETANHEIVDINTDRVLAIATRDN